MSQLMRENKETLELLGRVGWLAKAIDFLEATSSASLDELSNVSTNSLPSIAQHKFVAGSNRPKTLTALCFVSNVMVERGLYLKGAFLERWWGPARAGLGDLSMHDLLCD
jgi:hypothetical protein